MITVDTNILVYAHRRDATWHEQANAVLRRLAEGPDTWAIPWPCLHEFLSIVTHPRIYRQPTPLETALDQVDAWLESPGLCLLAEASGAWDLLRKIVSRGRVTGPVIHDARVASLCLLHGHRELWTVDRDFGRLAELRTRNPLIESCAAPRPGPQRPPGPDRQAAAGRSILGPGMRPVPFVLGPTGIGKSRAAFEVARALGGEIVVCDSRQVYDRLDIATNKPPAEWMREVRYHLVGVADPRTTYTAFRFLEAAGAAIADIAARGRLAVVEGGTMLWADALAEGFSLAGVPPRPERRAELEGLPLPDLVGMLERLDPAAAVDRRNPVRVVRAIEVLEAAGPPLARLRGRRPPPWTAVRVGLIADRATIDRRLADRSREQVRRGLVAETRAALEWGVPRSAAVLTGIGYAEALRHLDGEVSLEDLADLMATANRRYARRQLRWFRRSPAITWFDATVDPVPGILGFLREQGL